MHDMMMAEQSAETGYLQVMLMLFTDRSNMYLYLIYKQRRWIASK